MAVSIGPKIGVEGEAEYRSQMSQVISKTKALQAEMTALKTAVTDESTAEENARRIAENHAEQVETQKERVRLLTEQLEKCKAQTGENSTETNKYREQLANAKTVLNQLESQTDSGTEAMEDFADAEDEAGEGALSLGDLISANLISEAVISGLKKLAQLAWEAAKGLVECASNAAQYADDVLTMATVTGLSTDQIQEFSYMADMVDVSLDTMTSSMSKLTKTMQSARKGGKDATAAFEALGVRTTNADGSLRDSTAVFFDVIDALAQMEEGTERDALAMTLFGRSAQALNPLIAAGSGLIETYRAEAHRMGYVLDNETLESLGELANAYSYLNNLQTTIRNRLGAAMAPAIERVLEKLIEFAERVDWETLGTKLGNALEVGADKLIELLDGIDIDKAAQGAMTLLEGIISGIGWILDHADEIVKLIKDIAIGFAVGKGMNALSDAKTIATNFFSGWGKGAAGKTGAGAVTGGATGGGLITAAGGTALVGSVVLAGIETMEYLKDDYASMPETILQSWGAVATEVRNVGQAFEDMNNALLAVDPNGENAEVVEEWQQALENYRTGLLEMTKGTASEDALRFLNENLDAIEQAYTAHAEGRAGAGADAEAYKSLEYWLAEVSAQYLAMQGAAKTATEGAADAVETELGGLSDDAAAWGADMMTSFANGMTAGFNGSVLPTALSIAAGLAGLFAHSEPKVGPLSNDSTWMPDMMESFASGIRDNRGLVLDEMNALASDMAGSMNGGGGTTMNYGGVTVVFQVQDGQDGRALFEQFSDWLAQSVYREGADLA